jgi:hypothetical protein
MKSTEPDTGAMGPTAFPGVDPSERFLRSSFYERLVEHVFISELLQEAWFRFGASVEVLRSEVDNSGYDVLLECNGVIRHVQLKTSEAASRTRNQKINVGLASKPSGCVVWIVRTEDPASCRMRLRYRFFGNTPGLPLSLDGLRIAKHVKGDSKGVKKLRPAIRVLPGSRFEDAMDATTLLHKLFGSLGLERSTSSNGVS